MERKKERKMYLKSLYFFNELCLDETQILQRMFCEYTF